MYIYSKNKQKNKSLLGEIATNFDMVDYSIGLWNGRKSKMM